MTKNEIIPILCANILGLGFGIALGSTVFQFDTTISPVVRAGPTPAVYYDPRPTLQIRLTQCEEGFAAAEALVLADPDNHEAWIEWFNTMHNTQEPPCQYYRDRLIVEERIRQ